MSIAPTVIEDALILEDIELHRACEHHEHGNDARNHADGDERFIRYVCPTCGPSPVAVRCGMFVTRANAGLIYINCRACGTVAYKPQYIDLGPANGG